MNASLLTPAARRNVFTMMVLITRAARIEGAIENTEGPDPEIEHPSAPALSAASFTSSNPGMSLDRSGSMITSSTDRLIKF
jgi:hypothetical protein